VVVLCRDLMAYGFREEYYTHAREKGVVFVAYEPEEKPKVTSEGRQTRVEVLEPTLGSKLTIHPDLVVLSPAIEPHEQVELANMLGLETDRNGFFQEAEAKFRPVETLRDGVFLCGLAHSPRDVRETITQAKAAAQRVVSLLGVGKLLSGRVISAVNARRCTACGLCIEACPYNVRVMYEEERVAVVREALCRGCGACTVACPNGASHLRGFSERQIFAMLDVV
jgi:heterodisulfide reductase subunit A